jgi:hypothetical protein
MGAMHQAFVFPLLFSFLPFVVLWHEFYFYKPVEFRKQDIGEDRAENASYNVAKKVLEFEYQEEIPRHRLRAAYGDGFKGAPLRCQVSGEGAFPPDAGMCDGKATQTLATFPQKVPCSGGSCHV